ncbi:unnamed protein product [Trichobilharzia regenti]|nr:unnamed protein product [Trichobilharzia regenti]
MIISHPLSVASIVFENILRSCMPYVLVLTSFLIFVIMNGGIVLRNMEAHKAVLNIPQFFYFVTFYAFSSPFLLLEFIVTNFKFLLFVHPYLISDNKHCTYYILYYSLPTYFALLHHNYLLFKMISSGLFGLRYFLIPFIFWRIFSLYYADSRYLYYEILYNFSITLVIEYPFTYKSFEWSRTPGIHQRFIWLFHFVTLVKYC